MKKIALISLISLISLIASPVLAAPATPSAQTASPSAKDAPPANKAQELLNRVADRVTALTDKMRRSYQGNVKSVGKNSYSLTSDEGNKVVVTNDATSFYRIRAGSRTEIEFKDIKANDYVVAVGTIDPSSSEMTAKQVIAKIHRFNYVGTIDEVGKGIVTMTLLDNSQVKVDLSDALAYKKIVAGKIQAAKLADFKQGSTMFVIAFSADPKTGVYSSLKALVM